ncbi:hypothetical protein SLAVM298S_06054 [Streptomyces lavendulae subsp. lavendulae]
MRLRRLLDPAPTRRLGPARRGVGDRAGPSGIPSTGATVVFGSWLPPAISVVLASGATPEGADGPSSRSVPDSGGANTVAGSGTEAPSPPEFTSVPAHGVDPDGTPSPAAGSRETSPSRRSGTGSAAEPAAAAAAGAAGAGAAGGIPARSAASCSHSGGLSMKEVCSESIRGGGTEASAAAATAAAPYSSS